MRKYHFPNEPWMQAIADEICAEQAKNEGPARKRAKLEALIAEGSGATEGERAACIAALDRINERSTK